jgi:anthranilate/para-aminobenzoate synthase component II
MAHGGNVKSLGEARRQKVYEEINIINNIHSDLFKNMEGNIQVYQCHNDYLNTCPEDFNVTAMSKNGVIEAIECPKKLRFGVQFHPENSSVGHLVLDNFVNFCNNIAGL